MAQLNCENEVNPRQRKSVTYLFVFISQLYIIHSKSNLKIERTPGEACKLHRTLIQPFSSALVPFVSAANIRMQNTSNARIYGKAPTVKLAENTRLL